jgi:hypothetical protein
MAQQTAVEWFNQQLVDRQNGKGDSRSWDEILQRAKQMEKEQIKDAFKHGELPPLFDILSAEQYYKEKYNK